MADEDCPGCGYDPMAPHNGKGSCGREDWSDPGRIPLGYGRMRPAPGEDPDPRYIQTNLFTIVQIGGVYEMLALEVERQHLSILEPWRLDSGAPRAIDYIRNNHRHRAG
uniref:Uncharacterized protein n=1 Tax=Micrococcus phage Olihed TaxID=3092209 RepID=A0AAU6R6E7_9CAUD